MMALLNHLSATESTSSLSDQGNTIEQSSHSTMIAKPKCSSFTETSIVEVKVGTDNRTFHVHKEKLCAHSEFFKSKFHFDANSDAMNAEINIVSLGDDRYHDPDAFACVANWLYDKELAFSEMADELIFEDDPHRRKREALIMLTKIYIEADILIMPALKDHVVKEIVLLSSPETPPSPQVLSMLRGKVPSCSRLRQYFIDCIAYWLWRNPEVVSFEYHGSDWYVEAQQLMESDGMLAFEIVSQLCNYHRIKADKSWPEHPNEGVEDVYLETPPRKRRKTKRAQRSNT